MARPAVLTATALIALIAAGCGEARKIGDADGVPTDFQVGLTREFVSSMESRRGRVGMGVGHSWGSGGRQATGIGLGVGFQSTSVEILGGTAPAKADLFRKPLSWGNDNRFTVPLRPGRPFILTIVASGGREGWESLGEIKAPGAGQIVDVHLDKDGGTVQMKVKPAAPAKPATEGGEAAPSSNG